ncbi:MAG: response regulator [Ferruginibacter sp.]|nr:response regulator [Ferruginibacter sp.]
MRPYILLVDDDPDDLLLITEAIIAANSNYELKEAGDGRMALNFLKSLNKKDDHPCLIVLDINMPVLDGRELLAILKSDTSLKDVPVIFFTTSSNPADINYAAQFNVELMTKPFNMNLLSIAAKKIISYCKS